MARLAIRLTCVLLVWTAVGCTDDDPDAGVPPVVTLYVTVLEHLEFPPPENADDLPVVYVVGPNAAPLNLDDQVAIINALDTALDIRFVDDVGAVVEFDEDGALGGPADGVLVAIGTPIAESHRTLVRVKSIAPDGDITARQLGLGDGAEVDHDTTLEPELLVPLPSP